MVKEYIEQDLYFGITSYISKTKESLEILKRIPLERIILESSKTANIF